MKKFIFVIGFGLIVSFLGFNLDSWFYQGDNFWDRTMRFIICGIGAGITSSAVRLLLDLYHLTHKGKPMTILGVGIILGGAVGYGFASNVIQYYVPFASPDSTGGDVVIFTSLVVGCSALGIQGFFARVTS
ncbi:hypothetical protein [Alteromonas gilva]|uniref:Uncharacterized protein n=1 Tax=Alteromonas gilva TaxID=2987522 RepID=A0ABT5L8I1_9ALTE|nr:hypothetical protein [Alteromonas gilva]MDC8832886.1 hypothetical protein [Alteromonas gilva]